MIDTHAPDIGVAVERRCSANTWLESGDKCVIGSKFVELAAARASDEHRVISERSSAGIQRSAEAKRKCWCKVATIGAVRKHNLVGGAGQNVVVGRVDESCKVARPASDLHIAQVDECDRSSSVRQVDVIDA